MPLNNEDIQQLISILQRGLSNEPETVAKSKKTTTKKSKNIKTKKTKASQQQDSENKFIAMGFHTLHKEDIAIDRALNKNPPTPRNRQFKAIDVQCRVCGRKESINPSLLYEAPDRYKCNRCSSSPG
jgi:hypothetical protein